MPLLTGVLGVVPFIVLFDFQGCAPHAFAADLSTNAGAKTTGEPHFIYFVVYYGSDNYACRWVEAVFTGSAIGFDNGDADFSLYGILGRLQGMKKDTTCMSVLVYVIHEMESAVGKCEGGERGRERRGAAHVRRGRGEFSLLDSDCRPARCYFSFVDGVLCFVVISLSLRDSCTHVHLAPSPYCLHTAAQGPCRHNAHLWMFGKKGIQIFTPDGATIVS